MSLINTPMGAKMRATIAHSLPAAFDAAIQSYQEFYGQKTPDDAKAFSAHHSACKAAIAHLQLLIKLAAWVEEDANDVDMERLNASRLMAEEELDKFVEAFTDE